MKTALKYLAGLAIILLILVVSVALLLMTVVNSDWLKTQISDYAKASTGRDFVIKGRLHASFWPRLGVSVDDVSLSNPDGFSKKPFLSAHKLIIVAEIMPLLHHELSVKRATLNEAVINLQKNQQGKTNWSFTAQSPSQPKPFSAATEKKSEQTSVQFNIAALTLSRTTINYTNMQNNQHFSLQDVNVTTSHLQLDEPFPIKGQFIYVNDKQSKTAVSLDTILAGNTKNSTVHFNNLDLRLKLTSLAEIKIQGDAQANIDAASITFSPLTVEMDNLKLQGNLVGQNLRENPQVSGHISSNTFNLRKLIAANGTPLSFKNKNAFAQVQITGDLKMTAEKISLKALTGTLDGQALSGELNYALSPNPSLNFALKMVGLKLEDYIPNNPSSASTHATEEGSQSKSSAALVANGSLTLERLQYASYLFSNVKTTLAYTSKQLNLQNFSAGIFGGTTRGNISINFSGNVPVFAIEQKMSGIQADVMLRSLLGSAQLSGSSDINIGVKAAGSSSDAIKRSLTGNLTFSVNNGVISGADIDYKVDQAISKYTKRTAQLTDRGHTPFTHLTGTTRISDGIATNSNLELLTPTLRVQASGSDNLISNAINYKLVCRLLKPQMINANYLGVKVNADLANYDIPATVGCTLQSPCVNVDLLGLMKVLAQEGVKKAAKNVVKSEILKHVDENVGNAINNLFSK